MSNRLEDFVNANRDEFDNFEPGPVVWHNVQQELKKGAAKKGILISIKTIRWAAAAMIVLVLGAGSWYFMTRTTTKPDLAGQPAQPGKTIEQPATASNPDTGNGNTNEASPKEVAPSLAANSGEYSEEMMHYARLIEIKQDEIKKIQKDEPLLYQQFAGDFNKLDSTFHILKKQLPSNPNHEQLLEAMIQNLQYQEALLNQQLNIIKKINHAKKQAYEDAYRTI